jgi:antitoxin CptB
MNDDRQLRWRLRRGMKELDLLLGRYFEVRHAAAPQSEQAQFLALLEREDPDIWSWLMGYAPAPAELADIVQRLRALLGATRQL